MFMLLDDTSFFLSMHQFDELYLTSTLYQIYFRIVEAKPSFSHRNVGTNYYEADMFLIFDILC